MLSLWIFSLENAGSGKNPPPARERWISLPGNSPVVFHRRFGAADAILREENAFPVGKATAPGK